MLMRIRNEYCRDRLLFQFFFGVRIGSAATAGSLLYLLNHSDSRLQTKAAGEATAKLSTSSKSGPAGCAGPSYGGKVLCPRCI